jgi:serpin B
MVRWFAAAVVLTLVAAACGDDADDDAGGPRAVVSVGVLNDGPRAEPDPGADPSLAGQATLGFGAELFAAMVDSSGDDENVVVSPLSVAIALAMVEPGASGDAQQRLRELLRMEDPAAFHAAMNALEQSLEARAAGSAEDGEVTVRVANAAYLQEGYPFRQDYLDAVGNHYGPVLNAVDFAPDPDAVAHEINRFVDDETRGRITDLIPDGALDADTRLALVNALYLKASWLEVFDVAATDDGPFTRTDGSRVTVPMMRGTSSSSAQGDGWVAATKSYVGGLETQFILPDEGRFDDVARDWEQVVAQYEERATRGAELVLPRFETRFGGEISDPLKALGLAPLYEERGLLGIADDPRLVVQSAFHRTFVAMDEEGTEAAAATAIIAGIVSAPAVPPVPVILDRPFLFRIFDEETGATLFLGRILDPTA